MSTTDAPTSALVATPSTLGVVGAIVRRTLLRVRRMPSAFLPSLVMPVFQLVAFSGAFAGALTVAKIRNSLDWYAPMTAIQGAAFGAMGIAFGTVNDLQSGFFDRLRMAPAGRNALVAGPLVASVVRAILPVALVLAVAFIGGAALPGGFMGLVAVFVAAVGVAFVAAGFGLGLAYRMRSLAAAALSQFAIFFLIFLSTAQMPLSEIQGWVGPIARVNPITNVLRLARCGFLEEPLGGVTWENTWGGLLALAVMGTMTTIFARRGLRSFDK